VITNQVADLGKRLTGFVKISRDRTRELDLLRAKSDFVTIAAHQLRTPTTGMTWALTALAKETNLSKDGQEALVIARKTASHLATVIDELIGLAQLEEGKFGYQFKKTALEPFLDKLLGELQVVAQEYQVALYFERPGESDLTAEIDPARLAVAVAALVDNAIKYNVPNGKVTVGMKKLADKSYLEISVKDTGIGIEADDLKKLFTKFFRGKGAEKSAAAGSGLGLYLAKNIINRHGGEIAAESEPGRGTTFRFTISHRSQINSCRRVIYARIAGSSDNS
jgi:signal transduction histidine kinase